MRALTTDDRSFRVAYEADKPFRLRRYWQQAWLWWRRHPAGLVQLSVLAGLAYLVAVALATGLIWISASVPFLNAVVILVVYFLRYALAFSLTAGMFLVLQRVRIEHLFVPHEFWLGLTAFGSIGLAKVIQLLLMAVPMLVILILAGIGSYDELMAWAEEDLITPFEILRFYRQELRLLGLALIPYLLVQTLYLFTTPLILLGRLRFWTAMEVSRKIVVHHYKGAISLMLIIGGMWFLGFLSMGFGLLLAFPLTYGLVYAAYADLTEEDESPFNL